MEDKRNSYFRLREMLVKYKGKTLTLFELQGLVTMNIGSTDKTVSQAVRTMGITGLIKDIGNFRFKVL